MCFHLPGEHTVLFDDQAQLDDVVSKPSSKTSKFLAWMEANKKYPEGRHLTYTEFPSMFVWQQNEQCWKPRKKGFKIGRIHFVHPGSGELYYLRNLLNFAKGCTSYQDILTVDNDVKECFKDACYAMGLLDDEKEYIDGIIEASHWGTAYFLRKLFTTLLVANQLSQPELVWTKTWEHLTDDILHREKSYLQLHGNVFSVLFFFPLQSFYMYKFSNFHYRLLQNNLLSLTIFHF